MLFFTLLLTYCYFPPTAGWNENSRFDLSRAIVDQGQLFIDSYHHNTGDKAICAGGHYCSDKAPGASFAGVLPYALYRGLINLRGGAEPASRVIYAGAPDARPRHIRPQDRVQVNRSFAAALYVVAFFVAMMPGALTALLLVNLCSRFNAPRWASLAVGAIYGLGTMAFPYSTTLYGHQLAALLLTATVSLIERAPRGKGEGAGAGRRRGLLLCAGLAGGYGILTEYPLAVPVVGLGIYLLATRRRDAVWFALGAAPAAIGLGLYHRAAFGSPLSVGYGHLTYSPFARDQSRGVYGVTYPRLAALYGTLFGRFRGLFYASPVLALSLVGWIWLWRRGEQRRLLLIAAAVVIYFVLLNSSYYMWWGGAAAGPRHVLPMLPLMSLPLIGLVNARRWYWRALLALSSLLSVLNITALTGAGLKASEYIGDLLLGYAWPRVLGLQGAQTQVNLGNVLGIPSLASMAVLVSLWALAAMVIIPQLRGGSPHAPGTENGPTATARDA